MANPKTKNSSKQVDINWEQLRRTMELSGVVVTPEQIEKIKANHEQLVMAYWFVKKVGGVNRALELINLLP